MEKIIQTAGRDTLGNFAPAFAHFNDDIPFGENWNNTDLDRKTRSLLTVIALMASGITDSSLTYHLQTAKQHGVTQKEIAAAITHTAFYAGWPKAWAVFRLAAEGWPDEDTRTAPPDPAMRAHAQSMMFPIGAPNDQYAPYFTGQSYLAPVCTQPIPISNVTFEPACRNHWHIHHAEHGGGQILLCIAGQGYYQEQGKTVTSLRPGSCVAIPPEVKHWHGATPDSWFSHLTIEVPGTRPSTEWCEPVSEQEYHHLSPSKE